MQLLFFLAFSQNYQRSAPIRHQPLTLRKATTTKKLPDKIQLHQNDMIMTPL